ncbi:hypothetical protein LCGC14_1738250 [marine sediment metagenome]|uniref:NnrU domain-containing protein n=1 Tax=marine sediment metagenome TaxID=412755 RepID=A0A0F9H7I6_9ZZZZ
MNFKGRKIKRKIEAISTRVSSILIPLFQYVPTLSIWRGIMSVPLITYILFFFQNQKMLANDYYFLYQNHGIYFIIIGFWLFIFSIIFQLTHRKQLIRTGPYKFMRHPQYLAFILMTFGMTLIVFQTTPVVDFNPFNLRGYTVIFYTWICEVLAYVILGKIEDIALKAKYGEEFVIYKNTVSFMFPTIKLKKKDSNHKDEK